MATDIDCGWDAGIKYWITTKSKRGKIIMNFAFFMVKNIS